MSTSNTGKQHVEMYRKVKLRKSLLDAAGFTDAELTAYVPFIGEGDIAAELYTKCHVYGADIDPQRSATAADRLSGSTVITADCDRWPFPECTLEQPFAVADFDSYSNPYPSFKSFWANAPKAETMVLFFTDGHRQTLARQHRQYNFETDAFTKLEDTNAMRKVYNNWLKGYVLPWVEETIAPYRVIAFRAYPRQMELYWGIVITTDPARQVANETPKKEGRRGTFLECLGEGHSVTHAAKQIGASRKTVYAWRNKSPRFADDWDMALEMGADNYEDFLYESASSGNVTAIIVGLKMKGRFVERHELAGPGGKDLPSATVIVLPANERGDTTE